MVRFKLIPAELFSRQSFRFSYFAFIFRGKFIQKDILVVSVGIQATQFLRTIKYIDTIFSHTNRILKKYIQLGECLLTGSKNS